MAGLPSNIRVFVTFKDATVFAGDDVEATITFRNVEPKRAKPQRPGLSVSQPNGSITASQAASQPASRPVPSRNPSVASQVNKASHLRASRHRPAISLNIVDSASARSRGPASASGGVNIAEPSPRTPTHGRSVSIVSLGSDASRGDRLRGSKPAQTPVRPGFKHGRSASVQISSPTQRVGRSPSLTGRSTLPSPLSAVASPRYRSAESYFLQKPGPVRGSVSGNAENIAGELSRGQLQQGFRFPPSSSRPHPHRNATTPVMGHPRSSVLAPRPMSPPADDTKDSAHLENAPVNRVLSLSSETGTPRSSGDFYSLSNRSDETLASDYQTQPTSRLMPQRPAFNRSPSNLNPAPARKGPETLMMGYVQVSGNFVLDGSLVNAAPFEEIKRKAVLGGQGGGGVVGIEQKKQDTGLFGSFGWGNIGESLGGLLRGGEQSSIKEMKSIATSKSIPLLSTPKSILFVDLKLNPGESRSYSYTFPLPRGLPPSHRGRAIKITYQLVIGTQRPSGGKAQQIRQVEVPFRVFCTVNAQGDILGHDLMNPHIILHDKAKTFSIGHDSTNPATTLPQTAIAASNSSSEADFATYIQHLLNTAREPYSTLLSPTAEAEDLSLSPSITMTRQPTAPSPSAAPLPSARNLIDNALRLAASPATGLPTSFTIARSSNTIAVLTLSRPALRLGDTLHVALDFGNAAIPCYAIDASLETIETIDPSLAIRSAASVERATRRVWDKRAEHGFSLGWCGRWGGRLKIPWNATPGFDTTGISCKWVVRVEIVVGVDRGSLDAAWSPSYEPEEGEEEHDINDDASDEEQDSALSEDGSELPSERGEMQALDPNAPNSHPSHRRSTSSARRRSAQLARARARAKTVDRARLLLEDVGQDERGRHLAARQRLLCESFDVCVPLRVFGAAGAGIGSGGGGISGTAAVSGPGRAADGEVVGGVAGSTADEGLVI